MPKPKTIKVWAVVDEDNELLYDNFTQPSIFSDYEEAYGSMDDSSQKVVPYKLTPIKEDEKK